MVNNMYSIETKKLTKKFKDKIAVNGIDLNIKQGELFALLGTNGAGKTTTIKMLSGLILPTSGSIKILDMDMKKDILEACDSVRAGFTKYGTILFNPTQVLYARLMFFQGQGIKIASRESEKTEHGRKVAELLRYLVPKSTILTDEDYNDEINDFDIYTTSLSFGSDKFAKNVNKSQELFENNKFLICAVGNHSSDSQTAISKNNYFQSIGACSLKNGKPVREYYSSITDDLDFMCLTNFKLSDGIFNGSSCAAPTFASMICLLQSTILDKFNKKLSNKELLALIKQNLIDLEKEGHDSKTGHGLFILPKPWNLNYTYEEEEEVKRYQKFEEIPEWGKPTVEKLMKLELLKGNEKGELDISHDMLRIFVIEDRAGLYDF